MYSFKNDYSEGAHERILEVIAKTNRIQTVGYGMDEYCASAREKIKSRIACEEADVHFFVGGTQCNTTVIASILKPYQAVIAAHTGHINVHETGAIESTGHKVVAMYSEDGKLTPNLVKEAVSTHSSEHMVVPKLVYISDSTEIGTLYTLQELKDLYACCKELGLYLFMDGARLGSALCAKTNDIRIEDLPKYTDVFYIGGTKNGALFGEAAVITREELKEDFRFYIKQRGALLAKGRLLGIQFEELFTDDLFFELAEHANEMSLKLREAVIEAGYSFLADSYTNQQFVILPDEKIKSLEKEFLFEEQHRVDETHTCIRLCTSWATTLESVEAFRKALLSA